MDPLTESLYKAISALHDELDEAKELMHERIDDGEMTDQEGFAYNEYTDLCALEEAVNVFKYDFEGLTSDTFKNMTNEDSKEMMQSLFKTASNLRDNAISNNMTTSNQLRVAGTSKIVTMVDTILRKHNALIKEAKSSHIAESDEDLSKISELDLELSDNAKNDLT